MKNAARVRATDPQTGEAIASWYVPGLVDGFGDRLLMFDNTEGDPLELLRFNATLAAAPGFEDALHARVRELERLSHPAFPSIRAVERLETDGSLVLLSTFVPGKRLSTLFAEPRPGQGLHPAFVTWILSQVIEPLAKLQASGRDIAHTALSADRIILTPDGRVRVVEHVLGAALRQLGRSPAQLWREFGLVVPPDGEGLARLDPRADVFQAGALALSMLLARRMTPADFDERLPALLEQCNRGASARSRLFDDSLRLWLARALQIGDRPYASAAEAYADLRELPSPSPSRAFEFLQAGDVDGFATTLARLQSSSHASTQEIPMASPAPSSIGVHDVEPPPLAGEDAMIPDPSDSRPLHPFPRAARPAPPAPAEPAGDVEVPAEIAEIAAVAGSRPRTFLRTLSLVAAGLAAVAVLEALVIAAMFFREPGTGPLGPTAAAATSAPAADPVQALPPAVSPPLFAAPAPAVAAPAFSTESLSLPAIPPPPANPDADALAAAIARAASNQRSGGVRLSAPIELSVIQGDRVLGSSSDGPIVTTAGIHQLDLVNTQLGFRTRRAVTFRAGEITTLTIPVPPGRVHINAEPWAEVWIDDRSVGETPLANLEIPIGQHEIVFRHPEFGERRQNVTVRADTIARVSATFQR